MTSNGKDITLPSAAAQPGRVGQGTAVEQSRAIAEVQGAIIVAQRVPRNVAAAVTAMEESCKQKFLAEKAFFSFRRGGGTVAGLSVYLARELARCWGNVQYGVDELRRDDEHGQSELLAWAWDVQTNTRVSTKFIVPHMRDRSVENGGPVRLTDMRDIYENNANAGARRVRECIVNILPAWFVDTAKSLCTKTLQDGGGVPLQKRVADTIANFAKLGITQQQLEKKQGRGSNAWTEMDVAQLHVIGRSIHNGELQREEAFEPDMPSASDFKDPDAVPEQKPAPVAEAVPPIEQSDGAEPMAEAGQPEAPDTEDGSVDGAEQAGPEPKVASVDVAKLVNLLGANGVKTRVDQVAVINLMTDSTIGAFRDLTVSQHKYLMTRIAALVEDGTFAETVKKATAGATS
ncbi:hypothetical protein [Amycolatopsis lurida]|uniref:hypothetical protein n=1 Tax=Amycolatopsis lurida TaxID=31959 RepID=UPI0036537F0D